MTSINKPIKLALVEDHSLFREMLIKVFDMDDKWRKVNVVFSVDSGKEMIKQLKIRQPDVILMDLRMPEMDGVEATTYVKNKYPDIKVIVLSMFEEKKIVIELIKCGAKAYLTKSTSLSELHHAINTVLVDDFYYNDLLTEAAVKGWFEHTHVTTSMFGNVDITKREHEVLALICRGQSTCEIASELGIGTRTIDGYRGELLSKTGARNTASLVKFAMENDLVPFDLKKRQRT